MTEAAFPYGCTTVIEGRLDTLGASLKVLRYQGSAPLTDGGARHQVHWLELVLAPRSRSITASFSRYGERSRHEPMGDLVFLPAGEEVKLRTDTGPRHTAIVCEIDPGAFRHWTGADPHIPSHSPERLLDIPSGTIRHLMRRLAEETTAPGIASPRLTEALFVQLTIELARYCEAAEDSPEASGLAGWRLRLIDERVADFANPPSLSELAALCGMSVRQLTRAFRASRGSTLGEHQLQLRLEAAKRALAGTASIKQIAFSLGFSSPSRLAHAFRRSFAITPLQYRQRVLRQERESGWKGIR
ncbi:AraC family transcriptional regulator [Novosphingobium sp. M1R2S20]|uniref:Helix-turn-helix domain-containing protein n=1 Tax=Novosphingobium rhizovicinum TaxID=3228928 RepID=A0ABV3RC15_9SPHN